MEENKILKLRRVKVISIVILIIHYTHTHTLTSLFWGAPNSLQMVVAAMKLKDACSLEDKL